MLEATVALLLDAAVGPPSTLVPPTLTAVTIVLLEPENVICEFCVPCMVTEGVYPAAVAGP